MVVQKNTFCGNLVDHGGVMQGRGRIPEAAGGVQYVLYGVQPCWQLKRIVTKN